jgi:hypothetical protein
MKEPAAAFRDSLLMYSFIWAVLAIGCFQVLPRLEIASAAQLQPWLGPAYLAGLGGPCWRLWDRCWPSWQKQPRALPAKDTCIA